MLPKENSPVKAWFHKLFCLRLCKVQNSVNLQYFQKISNKNILIFLSLNSNLLTMVGNRNGSKAPSWSLRVPKSESYCSKLGSGNVQASTGLKGKWEQYWYNKSMSISYWSSKISPSKSCSCNYSSIPWPLLWMGTWKKIHLSQKNL